MNKLASSLAVAGFLAVALTNVASAQFSLKAIPGVSNVVASGNSGGTPAADLGAQQDDLVRGYVAANRDVLNANSKMAAALGMKEDSLKLKQTADSMTEGSTVGNLEPSNKQIAVSTKALAAEMAKQPVLDANSKALYSAGLISLVSGVTKYVGVGKNVKEMTTHLSGASPMQLPKLQSAVFVVSKFPDSMSTVASALKTAVDFAKTNGIQMPAGTDDAMAAIGFAAM
ncbi:hypothetical protein WKW79_35745 [Variovorax robiniae]|uniref:Uncharacterized protein n=1 Tax=Variovorax robiniae TaxID=1836199 RepID=A0ABU8XJS7_9BURK